MIRVESLTRTYGDHTAVDQVSFEIDQGEIVGLLGHNGGMAQRQNVIDYLEWEETLLDDIERGGPVPYRNLIWR